MAEINFVGIFSSHFYIDYPIREGDWTLRVDAFVSYILNSVLNSSQ